jgi:predicted RNase H-like HicB family nuclease
MNKIRRSRIAEIQEKLSDLVYDLDVIREEEEQAYQNLPESIQMSERGDAMSEAFDNIEEAMNLLEEASSYLDDAKGE